MHEMLAYTGRPVPRRPWSAAPLTRPSHARSEMRVDVAWVRESDMIALPGDVLQSAAELADAKVRPIEMGLEPQIERSIRPCKHTLQPTSTVATTVAWPTSTPATRSMIASIIASRWATAAPTRTARFCYASFPSDGVRHLAVPESARVGLDNGVVVFHHNDWSTSRDRLVTKPTRIQRALGHRFHVWRCPKGAAGLD